MVGRPRSPPRGSRGRPDPGVIVGLHRTEPSCPGLALPLRAKLGQAPAPPGARPWTGREGPALCQGRRDSSPPPGPRPRDWPLHWSVRRADVSGRDFPGPNLPGRRRAETRLSQSGPGQCPRFRASQAVSRDSSLLLPPPVITLGIGGRPILFSSKKKKKRRNQTGGGSVT